MKKLFAQILFAAFALVLHGAAFSADRGTPEEAVALAKSGIAYLKANGKDKTIAEINRPGTKFKDRDLYLFMVEDTVVLASAGNLRMVGADIANMKDMNGTAFVKNALEAVKTSGKGWTDYMWPNPVTKAMEHKSAYMELVDGVAIGCGAYKP